MDDASTMIMSNRLVDSGCICFNKQTNSVFNECNQFCLFLRPIYWSQEGIKTI